MDGRMEMKMENSLVELVGGVEAYWTDARDRGIWVGHLSGAS